MQQGRQEGAALESRGEVFFGEQIQRSLYIGNVIYTISNKMVKANDLETIQYISDVKIPVQEYNDYPILYDNGGLMAI